MSLFVVNRRNEPALGVYESIRRIREYSQMHVSTRSNGASARSEASPEAQSTPIVVTPLIRTIDTSRPDRHKRRRKESLEKKDK